MPSESTIEIVSPDNADLSVVPGRSASRQPLGRPRVSTVVLMSVWVAALVLYLQVRPGG
ncbi:hypothetical protein [Nocardia sp. BMG51109]|uniref:hypothetical protein n=1 Tax=Nocardia sp. BMG51109 TaxID=1056816 RepID=UPI0004BB94D8|nr:hypothetical protein [Nocardia sp. BMG51109]